MSLVRIALRIALFYYKKRSSSSDTKYCQLLIQKVNLLPRYMTLLEKVG